MSLTRALVLVNVLAYLWLWSTHGLDTYRQLLDHGAMIGGAVERGEWWRIVTGAFLHGSLTHIFMNMIALWQVGMFCEALFGRTRFALVYVLAMVGAGLAVNQFTPPNEVTVGASGAIFGLFGALVAAGLRLGAEGRSIVQQTLPVIVINVLFTFAIPTISIAGHFGGLASGFVAGYLLYRMPYALVGGSAQQPVTVEAIDHQRREAIEGELLDPEPPR